MHKFMYVLKTNSCYSVGRLLTIEPLVNKVLRGLKMCYLFELYVVIFLSLTF